MIAVGLCVCWLLAALLSSCQDIDPRSVYTQAQKKMASLAQREETTTLKLIVDTEGEAEEYSWDLTARFIQNKNAPQMEIDSTAVFPKKELHSRTVYSDGMIYIDDNGETYRAEMEYSMLLTRIYRIYPELELSVSQLKELESSVKQSGLVLEFTVDAKTVQSIAVFAVDQLQNFGAANPTDVETKKATGRITVDENSYISLLELTIPCVILQNNGKVEAELKYRKVLSPPETKISIDMDSLDEYPQVSMWDLPW